MITKPTFGTYPVPVTQRKRDTNSGLVGPDFTRRPVKYGSCILASGNESILKAKGRQSDLYDRWDYGTRRLMSRILNSKVSCKPP